MVVFSLQELAFATPSQDGDDTLATELADQGHLVTQVWGPGMYFWSQDWFGDPGAVDTDDFYTVYLVDDRDLLFQVQDMAASASPDPWRPASTGA